MTLAEDTMKDETKSENSSTNSSELAPKQEKMKDSKFLKIRGSKKAADKNDPFRFEGEGVIIKAKLIGVDDVPSARGDKMCQDSMQMLKAVVKASGEHKQRINLSISFQGVKIKDEKSGEVIHHHPVHLISFIAQDVNDSRAFGYIYGSPQGGHKFIAIKTEKAASQAVITLRDLFEIVLAMKNANKKSSQDLGPLKDDDQEDKHLKDSQDLPQKPNNLEEKNQDDDNIYSAIGPEENETKTLPPPTTTVAASEPMPSGISKNSALIDLLDLELDFESSVPPPKTPVVPSVPTSAAADPFETSFQFSPFQVEKQEMGMLNTAAVDVPSPKVSAGAWEPFSNSSPVSASEFAKQTVAATFSSTSQEDNRYACFAEIDSIPSVFENPLFVQPQPPELPPRPSSINANLPTTPTSPTPPPKPPRTFDNDIFSELDPLGKDRPIVDKNQFFSEIKSPRKKSLKDLTDGIEFDAFSTAVNQADSANVTNEPLYAKINKVKKEEPKDNN